MKIAARCTYCGAKRLREAEHVNRARRFGMKLFCNHRCFGLSRRIHKTKAQKVAEKRLYDMEYRRKNRELIKAKKAAHFKATYDPAKAAIERKKNMARHVAYCRRPEYRAWKREYDRRYTAREYGPFAEAYLVLRDLEREIKGRMSKYDRMFANGTLNKRLKRRKEHESIVGGKPKVRALGYA